MENCEVCGKDLEHGYEAIEIHTAKLIKRKVKKEKLGTAIASEYGKFAPVSVSVCNRHKLGLWIQRLIPGFLAFILIFIPIATLLSLIPFLKNNPSALFIISIPITLIPVYFLIRRITYEAYIASLLTFQPKNREAGIEYFGMAKYRRIMRNLANLDKLVDNENKK
ncbi:MAG TPA: hypothetical protein VMS73_06590 [Anaerolineaceae bacterium]|nr:hypothetical protein [Anaerolineaceae bacterium]